MTARWASKNQQGSSKAGTRSSSGFLFRKPRMLLLPEKHPIRVLYELVVVIHYQKGRRPALPNEKSPVVLLGDFQD
jgi:hypothetical protein